MHTCLHIAAAAVSGFHWAYCQLGVTCGNKLKLVVNWLNQKMALSSNVVDVAMSRTLKPNTDGMCIVTHNCRSVKSSTDSAKKNYVETTTLICRKSIGYCQMMLVMQTAAFSSSAVNTQSNLLTGRSYGGTAILCHRTPIASVKLMTNTRPHITAVEMKVSYRRHVAPFMPFL